MHDCIHVHLCPLNIYGLFILGMCVFRGFPPSITYLSVIEESQRGGLNSLELSIREENPLLHLQVYLCKAYWYLLIPSEFQRNEGF